MAPFSEALRASSLDVSLPKRKKPLQHTSNDKQFGKGQQQSLIITLHPFESYSYSSSVLASMLIFQHITSTYICISVPLDVHMSGFSPGFYSESQAYLRPSTKARSGGVNANRTQLACELCASCLPVLTESAPSRYEQLLMNSAEKQAAVSSTVAFSISLYQGWF